VNPFHQSHGKKKKGSDGNSTRAKRNAGFKKTQKSGITSIFLVVPFIGNYFGDLELRGFIDQFQVLLLLLSNLLGIFGRYSLGLFFTVGGAAHFVPSLLKFYLSMMPNILPAKVFLIYLSGVIEFVFGALLFFPKVN
jgi:hypothetical protein